MAVDDLEAAIAHVSSEDRVGESDFYQQSVKRVALSFGMASPVPRVRDKIA
jgi:hypothetical protein